jgi:hypothetical protein
MVTGMLVIPAIAIAWTALPEKSRELASFLFPEWIAAEAESPEAFPEAPRYLASEGERSEERPLDFSSPIDALQSNDIAALSTEFPLRSSNGDSPSANVAPRPVSAVASGARRFEETSIRQVPLEKGIYHQAPAPGALAVGEQNRFARLEKELVALGATYYRLETWGNRREWYRFSCFATPRGEASSYTRPFESLDRDPIRAIEKVLQQIRSWKGR